MTIMLRPFHCKVGRLELIVHRGRDYDAGPGQRDIVAHLGPWELLICW